MNGNSHRLLATGAWLAASTVAGAPAWQVAAGILPAVAFSAGPTSPDVDNGRLWKRLDGILPDELLGEGGPLGHRQLMHWWGLPAVAALAVYLVAPDIAWALWAGIVGWASHLVGDCLCGQAGYGTRKGIPLLPWWWHVGVGLKSGGITERLLVPLALAGVIWTLAGTPGLPPMDMPRLEMAR